MQVTQRVLDGKAVLALTGRFDFNTHREFREGYESLLEKAGVQMLEIDMGGRRLSRQFRLGDVAATEGSRSGQERQTANLENLRYCQADSGNRQLRQTVPNFLTNPFPNEISAEQPNE